jgi:hypothetical protein
MTTSHLQIIPDFYSSVDDCLNSRYKKKVITNPRYRNFTQTHFTAGDENQFNEYRDETNGDPCFQKINLGHNRFRNIPLEYKWSKYKDISAIAVNNTFQYIFHKFKKGIFIKIKNNELKVFLPFSKNNFINEWSDKIKVDPRFGSMEKFIEYINKMQGKKFRISVNKEVDKWYANNCLLRYEFPINEGDTNVTVMSNMFKELCKERKIPDIEFFINRRDFPIIEKNNTEPYFHLFGKETPLLSHLYNKYSPILSMVTTENNADIPIPTGDDWCRISAPENRFFSKNCRLYNIKEFKKKWKNKNPVAVFRGASTGCGVTIDTNMRLKLALLSVEHPSLLNAGITKWQLRPRKLEGEKYLQTIDVPKMNSLGINLVKFMSPIEQSEYKYIVHLDGHVSAFRLSIEMAMGSCILLVDSEYSIWFRSMLKPMIHYIPVKKDLSNLITQIKWCKDNDNTCKQIAQNSKKFYKKFLQKKGILDYLQKLLVDLKKYNGIYLYNTKTPLQAQLELEKKINCDYPPTDLKNIKNNIGVIPSQGRSIGILEGMRWIVNMVNNVSNFKTHAQIGKTIFSSKNSILYSYTLAGFPCIVKKALNKNKKMENIHETYIGVNVINSLIKYIPNFVFTFGKDDKDNVISENAGGIPFNSWLESNKFNVKDYLFILIQISYALQIAQQQAGFVHWDLTPWNILIQELPSPVSFDYMINKNNIIRVSTKVIPIIIDYGRSHVIYEGRHHGFVEMYRMSTIQDILTLLLTSIVVITNFNLSSQDSKIIITLANFLTGGKYIPRKFSNISQVRNIFDQKKKYSTLLIPNKYELEKLSPIDLITYIQTNFPQYDWGISRIDVPIFRMDKGNPRQVFEFVLARNHKEKVNSFINVFSRIEKCDLSKQQNNFFNHYAVQTLESTLTSVYKLLSKYLKNSGELLLHKHSILYEKVIRKLAKFYEKIDQSPVENIEYKIDPIFSQFKPCPYTEKTFLLPRVILNLLTQDANSSDIKAAKDSKDYIKYKYMIEYVLAYNGKFKLSKKNKKYYSTNFDNLFKINNINMLNNSATVNTLLHTAKIIYTQDYKVIDKKIKENKDTDVKCKNSLKYIKNYEKILNYISPTKKSQGKKKPKERKKHKKKETKETKEKEPYFTLEEINESKKLPYPKIYGKKILTSKIIDDDGNMVLVFNNFLSTRERTEYIKQAQSTLRKQGGSTLFKTPRIEVAYARGEENYNYSGVDRYTIPFPPNIINISDKIIKQVKTLKPDNPYNQYDTGVDILYGGKILESKSSKKFGRGGSISFHSDDEKDWGMVGVYSLGQTRLFRIKDYGGKGPTRFIIPLFDNSLVVMYGPTFQKKYYHGITKLSSKLKAGVRLSLNIRYIKN